MPRILPYKAPMAMLVFFFIVFMPRPCFSDALADLSGKFKDYNVILMTFDAMRPDHLGCYGYKRKTSPEIDELCQKSIVFENAFSNSSLTIMSVGSFYTSLYPFAHGLQYIYKDHLSPKVKTLAQILQSNGYMTVWLGSINDPHTGVVPGLLKGFQIKIDLEDDKPEINSLAITSWIREHSKDKFFMNVHSYRTHDESFIFKRYDNPFNRMVFTKNRLELDMMAQLMENWVWDDFKSVCDVFEKGLGKKWIDKNREALREEFRLVSGQLSFINDKKTCLRLMAQRYLVNSLLSKKFMLDISALLDSSIYEIDNRIIKGVVEELKKNQLLDKTIIIITADHGNEFLEHGNFQHGCFVYDESIHIPLIIYVPHLSGPLRTKNLTDSVDVLPTVLDLVDIPIPDQAQGVSQIKYRPAGKSPELMKYVFSESVTGQMSIRTRQWKLIGQFERKKKTFESKELYDLKKDPQEKRNVIRAHQDVEYGLRCVVVSKMSGMKKYNEEERPFLPNVDEQTRARIKRTGYW